MNVGRASAVLALGAVLTGFAVRAAAEQTRPHCVLPGPSASGLGLRAARGPGEGGGAGRAPAATTGAVRILVLLVEFSDVPHKVSTARFNDHLFGSGMSMRSYFADVSADHLDVTGDVLGWFGLPGSEFSYSQGTGGLGGYPNNGQKLAEDAVVAAIAQGVDLADYDADADGVVDALLVVHSGEGFEWAGSTSPALSPFPNPDAINSHKWTVVDGDFGTGTTVSDYFTCPEMQRARTLFFPGWTDSIATIGVYCHEFGHVLGLPDLYDTQTSESRIGIWDLMDAGIWARHPTDPALSLPGALPSHFSAWSKMFLGWTDAQRVAPPVGEAVASEFVLESVSTGGAPLQLRANPFEVDWSTLSPGSGEFFVAESRTRSGWDAGLPAEGLLIYHVDESRRGNRAADYADGAGLLLLVAQDRNVGAAQDQDDPWPGLLSTFGAASNPSTALHDGSASGVSLEGIAVLSAGRIAVSAVVTNLSADVAVPFARPHPFRPSTHGTVSLILSLDASPTADAVSIFDVLGRRVRKLSPTSPASRILTWDGCSDDGLGAPAGVYFFRTSRGARGRIVLVRD